MLLEGEEFISIMQRNQDNIITLKGIIQHLSNHLTWMLPPPHAPSLLDLQVSVQINEEDHLEREWRAAPK